MMEKNRLIHRLLAFEILVSSDDALKRQVFATIIMVFDFVVKGGWKLRCLP